MTFDDLLLNFYQWVVLLLLSCGRCFLQRPQQQQQQHHKGLYTVTSRPDQVYMFEITLELLAGSASHTSGFSLCLAIAAIGSFYNMYNANT